MFDEGKQVVLNKNSWSNFCVKVRRTAHRKWVRIELIRAHLRSLRWTVLRRFDAKIVARIFVKDYLPETATPGDLKKVVIFFKREGIPPPPIFALQKAEEASQEFGLRSRSLLPLLWLFIYLL